MPDPRICVAWNDLVSGETIWCRARYKRTTRYQDHVPTACGGVVTLPVGLSLDRNPTCPDCKIREDIRGRPTHRSARR